jgi:membrane-associated PAP2 superfamily phosphatase
MVEGARFVGWSDLLTGLLFIALALPLILRKVARNRWYGVRIPQAFAAEANWYAINAVGGRWMAVAGGVLALVGGGVLRFPPTTLGGLLVASLAPVPLVLFTLIPVLRFARRLPS